MRQDARLRLTAHNMINDTYVLADKQKNAEGNR